MNDVGKLVSIEKLGDNGGVAAIAQHADFHGSDVAIFNQDFQLFAQLGDRRVVNGSTPCVFCTVNEVIAAIP